ncbi:hypothetical protein AMTRI_Chr11g154860 [Amborella trichopoda]
MADSFPQQGEPLPLRPPLQHPHLPNNGLWCSTVRWTIAYFTLLHFNQTKTYRTTFGSSGINWKSPKSTYHFFWVCFKDTTPKKTPLWVFKALSPHYIYYFITRNHKHGCESHGAAVLYITGIAFSYIVYPCHLLTYRGEAAYLIKNPHNLSTTFYSSVPSPVFWPMFVIGKLMAIVTSQALISAIFSIIRQSMALGCFPRVNMFHTSSKHEGQVYSPGGELLPHGNAYGVVVIWVMLITTCLMTVVMLVIWDTNIMLIDIFFLVFISIEGVYMTSLFNKVPQGGWVPFAASAFFLIIMLSVDLQQLASNSDISRVSGVCFFCTNLINGALPYWKVRAKRDRSLVQYGYMDHPSMEDDVYVATVLEKLKELTDSYEELQLLETGKDKGVTFVMGRTILRTSEKTGWFQRLVIS